VILKGKMETVDFTDSTDWEQYMGTCRLTPKVNDPSAIPGCDQDIPGISSQGGRVASNRKNRGI
jgi:hypothetical protein